MNYKDGIYFTLTLPLVIYAALQLFTCMLPSYFGVGQVGAVCNMNEGEGSGIFLVGLFMVIWFLSTITHLSRIYHVFVGADVAVTVRVLYAIATVFPLLVALLGVLTL